MVPGLRRLTICVGGGDLRLSVLVKCGMAREQHTWPFGEATVVWKGDRGLVLCGKLICSRGSWGWLVVLAGLQNCFEGRHRHPVGNPNRVIEARHKTVLPSQCFESHDYVSFPRRGRRLVPCARMPNLLIFSSHILDRRVSRFAVYAIDCR